MDSQFMVVKNILRCLATTNGYGIHYVKCDMDLRAFSDADWAGDPNDRRSTTGFVLFLGLILSHGPPRNSKLRFVLLLKLNIKLRHPLLLNFT